MLLRDTLKAGVMLLILTMPCLSMAEPAATTVGGGDMAQCEAELETLQLAARAATDRAASANRLLAELEQCQNDAGGAEPAGKCENLQFEYHNQASDVELELRQLGERLKAVQLACGYDFDLRR